MKTPLIVGAVAGALVAAGVAVVLTVARGEAPAAAPFTAPAGSLATSRQEQDLLDLHEAYGTLAPEDTKLQRAILDAGHTLCDQLHAGSTTPALWTSVAADQGVPEPRVYTDFAIRALCRDAAADGYGA